MHGYEKFIRPLTCISPSRYYGLLQCRLREVLLSSGAPLLLPVLPGARMGTVIHSFFRSVIRNSKEKGTVDLEAVWCSCEAAVEEAIGCSNIERHLLPLQVSVPGYEVKKRLAFRTAGQVVARCESCKGATRLSEVWYQSKDGLVRGRVDSVISLPSGDVILEEYKTGSVAGPGEPGGVKDEYQLQLKLYSSLFWENTGAWPAVLRLVALDGKMYDIDFTPDECRELLASAREILIETNNIIRQSSSKPGVENFLATPGPGTCLACLYRPACGPYQEMLPGEASPGWPHDLKGILVGIEKLGNGRALIKVQLSPGGSGKIVTIRDVHLERHPALENFPAKIIVYNLLKECDSGYRETSLTAVYPLDS